MTDTPRPSADDSSREAALAYRDAMRHFEREMAAMDTDTQSIARRTTLIIRLVAWLTVCSTLYLGYTVFLFGGDAKRLADSMGEMYRHLGSMAGEVGDMNHYVTGMGRSMGGMPSIAEDVGTMRATMNHLNATVGGMDATLGTLDGEVAAITNATRRMDGEMARMTHSVNFMRRDIGEMAQPLP